MHSNVECSLPSPDDPQLQGLLNLIAELLVEQRLRDLQENIKEDLDNEENATDDRITL